MNNTGVTIRALGPPATLLLVTMLVLSGVATGGLVGSPSISDHALSDASSSNSMLESSKSAESGLSEDALDEFNGTSELIVRFDGPPGHSPPKTPEQARTTADELYEPLIEYADSTSDIEVLATFWVANAVLIKVDPDKVEIDDVASLPHVTEIHPNFNIPAAPTITEDNTLGPVDQTVSPQSDPQNGSNWEHDLINASAGWERAGTKGSGARIAIVDSGLDPEHPDIDLYTEDPSDPTYPGGWAEFDETGSQINGSTPSKSSSHGQHVSGIVAGGNTSGDYIGVAPEVDLLHAKVFGEESGDNFAAVVGAIEWAILHKADVVSLSLGPVGGGQVPALIEPVQRAKSMGTFVVGAAGNDGADEFGGPTGSPGNVFETIAVGSVDQHERVAKRSSGESIVTPIDWGQAAPIEWPESYVLPNVVAPGVDVTSTIGNDSYGMLSGTSMAAPHVAGALGILRSMRPNLSTTNGTAALTTTATKPHECVPQCHPRDGVDIRYGAGIIDLWAAIEAVEIGSSIRGTVKTQTGSAVDDAVLHLGSGAHAYTSGTGSVDLLVAPGEHEIKLSAWGTEDRDVSVTVPPGQSTKVPGTVNTTLEATQLGSVPEAFEAGDSIEFQFRTAHVDDIKFDVPSDSLSMIDDITLDQSSISPNNWTSFDGPDRGVVDVEIITASDADGPVIVQPRIRGLETEYSLDPVGTTIVEEFVEIAVVEAPGDVQGAQITETLGQELPLKYNISIERTSRPATVIEEFDGVVIQNLPDDNSSVRNVATAAERPENAVLYLEQWGDESSAISRLSNVTGNPKTVGQNSRLEGGPVEVHLNRSHAILDSIARPGISSPIHDGLFADHAWFNGFDGTTIAATEFQGSHPGDSIGYHDSDNNFYLASFGRSTHVTNSDFTLLADRLLGNALQHAIAVGESPRFAYDQSGDGQINSSELLMAIEDYHRGDLSEEGLRDVVDAWAAGTTGDLEALR